eukprot:401708_1
MPTQVVRIEEEWVGSTTIFSFFVVISILIFQKEWRNRCIASTKPDSVIMCFIPIIAFICTIISNTFYVIRYFNPFCYLSAQLSLVFALYFTFMGLYQIGRLQYCFSQGQGDSDKGYPNWLIYVMYSIGFILIPNRICLIFYGLNIPINCGINSEYQSVEVYTGQRFRNPENTIYFRINITLYLIVSFLWDSTTLCLYVMKIIALRKFVSQKPNVYKRIMSTLNRILLLTIFYEITWIFHLFASVFYSSQLDHGVFLSLLNEFAFGLSQIVTSYSLFLMQEHNNCQYYKFLKCTYCIGIYHILCCCFKSYVENEIEMNKERHSSTNNESIPPNDVEIYSQVQMIDVDPDIIEDGITADNLSKTNTFDLEMAHQRNKDFMKRNKK